MKSLAAAARSQRKTSRWVDGDVWLASIEWTKTAPQFCDDAGLAALGGFVSLSYEIFFFRTMSYASGSSATAFAGTLGTFLVGIVSGSVNGGSTHCFEGRQGLEWAWNALLPARQATWMYSTQAHFTFVHALAPCSQRRAGSFGAHARFRWRMARAKENKRRIKPLLCPHGPVQHRAGFSSSAGARRVAGRPERSDQERHAWGKVICTAGIRPEGSA